MKLLLCDRCGKYSREHDMKLDIKPYFFKVNLNPEGDNDLAGDLCVPCRRDLYDLVYDWLAGGVKVEVKGGRMRAASR